MLLLRGCVILCVEGLCDLCVLRGYVIFSLTHSLRLNDLCLCRLHGFFAERLHNFLWRGCMIFSVESLHDFFWVDRLRDCVWRGCVIFHSLTHSGCMVYVSGGCMIFFAEGYHNFFLERLRDFLCGKLV